MDTRTGRIYTQEEIQKMEQGLKHGNNQIAKTLQNLIPMKSNPTKKQMLRKPPKVGRNETCPCGSNKKFKYCCLEKDNG